MIQTNPTQSIAMFSETYLSDHHLDMQWLYLQIPKSPPAGISFHLSDTSPIQTQEDPGSVVLQTYQGCFDKDPVKISTRNCNIIFFIHNTIKCMYD